MDNIVKPRYERVRDELRAAIVSGEFQPGSRLKVDVLAERFSVSANPVREALNQLQGEGFVVIHPNQGARVRVVDEDFVNNIFELRLWIEPFMVARFCARSTTQDVAQLEKAVRDFEVAAKKEDRRRMEAANDLLHRITIAPDPNTEAIDVLDRTLGILNALRARLPLTRSRLQARMDEHRRLLECVREGDARGAEKAAADHLRSAAVDFLEQLRLERKQSARRR